MNKGRLEQWVKRIHREADKLHQIPRIMEICGSHTRAIYRLGLQEALQGVVEFLSGPGCPVCITPQSVIDQAIRSAAQGRVVATFGDLMRAPGSSGSLFQARSEGADIRVVYSPLDLLELAVSISPKKVTFLAIGFETTSPGTAILLEEVIRSRVTNLTILSVHRLIPPALDTLLQTGSHRITALLGPGHVSAITGSEPFQRISQKYHLPCVISGFAPDEILKSVLLLINQLNKGNYGTAIQYQAAVRPEGNHKARAMIGKYFTVKEALWRGLGMLPQSGLFLRDEYDDYNENLNYEEKRGLEEENPGCYCKEILRGMKKPVECPSFASACAPDHPLGPCMASFEGACHTAYIYCEG